MGCLTWLFGGVVMALALGWMYYTDPGLLWIMGIGYIALIVLWIVLYRKDKNN